MLLFLALSAACVGLVLIDGRRTQPTSAHFEAKSRHAAAASKSIVALLADPARHHQQRVAVSGFLVLEFEHVALYLDRPSQQAGLQENGVWIAPPLSISHPRMKKLSRSYVTVEGTFNAKETGYGAYSGTLQDITSIRSTLTEREYRGMQVGWVDGAILMAGQRLLLYAAIATVAAMLCLGLYRLVRRRSA